MNMKRRTFLSASGATLASILLPKLSLAEPANRAAIVIGVDRSGSLAVLRAAVSGALAFADWLDDEGFDVERFIDGTNTKVKVDPVFEAVNRIVTRGIYEQLVIYFSGHGFLNSYRELWMLSDAPDNPNQAISLLECERLCKRTGIPNYARTDCRCRPLPGFRCCLQCIALRSPSALCHGRVAPGHTVDSRPVQAA